MILILGSLSFSTLVIVLLYLISDKVNHQPGSFIRLFPPHGAIFSKSLDIRFNSYYIAGGASKQIYLGNFTAPLRLLITDYELSDTLPMELDIEDWNKLKLFRLQVAVDSPHFYIMDGIAPIILQGQVGRWRASRHMEHCIYFTTPVPISSSSFILTTMSDQTKENILAKQTKSPPYIKFVPNLLEKQVDGLFCTDGMLHYNPDLAKLVYVYYYRNQFICTDTSLNLLYRGNTIDTTTHAKIKIAEIKSNNSRTLANPPFLVNKKSCTSGNWLFVNSNLLSKNENRDAFERSSVIDVYDLRDGSYKLSFYIPDHLGYKLSNFKVFNNILFALQDHFLLTYRLNPEYFTDQER